MMTFDDACALTCPFFAESAIIFPIKFGFETFAGDSFPAPNISGKLVSN